MLYKGGGRAVNEGVRVREEIVAPRPSAATVCVAVAACMLRCAAPVGVGAEPPQLPTVGRGLDRPLVSGRGSDAIPFMGVIGHRKLAAGSYTATVSAHNAHGRSGSVSLRFNILA